MKAIHNKLSLNLNRLGTQIALQTIMLFTRPHKGDSVVSLNANGLNAQGKRSILMQLLQRSGVQVVFLQETQLLASHCNVLRSKVFPTAYCASDHEAKVKGVVIAIHKNCQLQVEEVIRDPKGRYIFVKGRWQGVPVMLANFYCPI